MCFSRPNFVFSQMCHFHQFVHEAPAADLSTCSLNLHPDELTSQRTTGPAHRPVTIATVIVGKYQIIINYRYTWVSQSFVMLHQFPKTLYWFLINSLDAKVFGSFWVVFKPRPLGGSVVIFSHFTLQLGQEEVRTYWWSKKEQQYICSQHHNILNRNHCIVIRIISQYRHILANKQPYNQKN